MLAIKQLGLSVEIAAIGVALAVALSGSGCDASPEGRVVASWALGQHNSTCQETLVDRVRVTAVKSDNGESATSGPRACTDGSAEVAVAGGTYLVGVDTLAADDTIIDHGEKIVVAAADGETPVTVTVETSQPTGFLHARWSPPCPNGATDATLAAVEQQIWTGPLPCGPGEMTSKPVPAGSGTARLIWYDRVGRGLGHVERPYQITGRGQVVELQF